jgi:putative flippase GtrA
MRVVREFVGYLAASSAALIVDVAVLWLLVRRGGFTEVPAATVSFLAGAVVAYQLSVAIAFREHRRYDRGAEFVSFVAIGALGVGINAAVIFVATRYAGLHFLIAKGIAAAFTFSSNFLLRRQLLFVPRASAQGP